MLFTDAVQWFPWETHYGKNGKEIITTSNQQAGATHILYRVQLVKKSTRHAYKYVSVGKHSILL